jgi:hypothetical protein
MDLVDTYWGQPVATQEIVEYYVPYEVCTYRTADGDYRQVTYKNRVVSRPTSNVTVTDVRTVIFLRVVAHGDPARYTKQQDRLRCRYRKRYRDMILIDGWISRLTISNQVSQYSKRNHNDSSDASVHY